MFGKDEVVPELVLVRTLVGNPIGCAGTVDCVALDDEELVEVLDEVLVELVELLVVVGIGTCTCC